MKATREQVIALAKEMNSLLDLKISTTAATKTEIITAQIESNIPQLTSADFAEDRAEDEGLSNAAIETYKLLGFKVPKKAEKKAADVVKGKEQKKTTKKEKKTAEKKFTRSDAAVLSIRELCKKGATLKQIVDRTDAIYVENGGNSVPDAINVNKYALNGLVAFKILELVDGKYKFVK